MLITLAELQNRVYSRVDGNQLLYGLQEVTDIINEVLTLTNFLLGYQQGKVQASETIPNRVWYDVPTGILVPRRLQYENRFLEPISIRDIGRTWPNWTQETTQSVMMPVSRWIPLGLKKFAIHPADPIGGANLVMTGILEPTPLVNPTDSVNWSKDVLTAFDLYVTSALALKESPATFKQAAKDFNSYQSIIKRQTYITSYKAARFFLKDAEQMVKA